MMEECRGGEYMIISTSEGKRRPQNLLVGEKNVEGVPSFTYLEALINTRNDRSKYKRKDTSQKSVEGVPSFTSLGATINSG
jgi:hypothetical protein